MAKYFYRECHKHAKLFTLFVIVLNVSCVKDEKDDTRANHNTNASQNNIRLLDGWSENKNRSLFLARNININPQIVKELLQSLLRCDHAKIIILETGMGCPGEPAVIRTYIILNEKQLYLPYQMWSKSFHYGKSASIDCEVYTLNVTNNQFVKLQKGMEELRNNNPYGRPPKKAYIQQNGTSVINISIYYQGKWDVISIEEYSHEMHYVKHVLYQFVNIINKYVENPSFSSIGLGELIFLDYSQVPHENTNNENDAVSREKSTDENIQQIP